MLKREGMRGKGLLISSSLTLYLSVSLPETPKDLFLPSSSWSIPEFLLYPFSSFFHFEIWLFIPPGFHSLLNSFAVPFDVVVSSSWYSSSSLCRVLFLLSLFLCFLSTWSFTWFLLSFPFSFSVCLRVWHPVYSSWYLADFFFLWLCLYFFSFRIHGLFHLSRRTTCFDVISGSLLPQLDSVRFSLADWRHALHFAGRLLLFTPNDGNQVHEIHHFSWFRNRRVAGIHWILVFNWMDCCIHRRCSYYVCFGSKILIRSSSQVHSHRICNSILATNFIQYLNL